MGDHESHVTNQEWHKNCEACHKEAVAIDWLIAVRKYGLERANAMFPND